MRELDDSLITFPPVPRRPAANLKFADLNFSTDPRFSAYLGCFSTVLQQRVTNLLFLFPPAQPPLLILPFYIRHHSREGQPLRAEKFLRVFNRSSWSFTFGPTPFPFSFMYGSSRPAVRYLVEIFVLYLPDIGSVHSQLRQ